MSIKVDLDDRESLLKSASTSLNSKVTIILIIKQFFIFIILW